MTDSEAHLVNAARAGDQRAFRQLLERHTRPLHRVCQRILGDAALAEDVLQDAFLNAWRGLPRFDGRSAFGSWLHRIAVNAALVQLRKRRPEMSMDVTEHEEDSVPLSVRRGDDPFNHAAGQQFGARLTTLLAALTTAERTAFVLRHFEDYPLDEIADALGCNVNACKQAIFRAVRKMRAALAPLGSAP